jgi:hypothetical protein
LPHVRAAKFGLNKFGLNRFRKISPISSPDLKVLIKSKLDFSSMLNGKILKHLEIKGHEEKNYRPK